ncbi:MAG: hypothetical protein WAS21_29900, partial [Geminicoccaceae bacterium]
LAKRCALVIVASTITVSSTSSGTPAVNGASQMPCCDQRRKRRSSELGLPNRSGRSSQATPVTVLGSQ